MSTKVLRVMSSPRGETSISRKLGAAIVKGIKDKYPDSIVAERDLAKEDFPHLREEQINLFFTPPEGLSASEAGVLRESNHSVKQLQDADIIVIEAPMYNYAISSYLKAYIDHIVRYGITFLRTEQGIQGTLKNKKVYIAFSSGFVYSEGDLKDYDHVTPYLEKMLGWIGLTNIRFFRAEGISSPDHRDSALRKAIAGIVID